MHQQDIENEDEMENINFKNNIDPNYVFNCNFLLNIIKIIEHCDLQS